MMEEANILLVIFSFLLSVGFTVFSIRRLDFLGIVSKDLHKKAGQKKPKVGGIGIAASFTIAIVAAYVLNNSFVFPAVLLAFLVQSAVGLLDDLLRFRPWRKLVLASFGTIPLLLLINLEPFAIIFLFLAVTVASNWTNMLAGFNGLEAGMGAIMLFFLALNTAVANTRLILFIYAAALLGFLLFNKYPAKIFPGDTGTMAIGTVLVAATLIGAPFYKLAILFIPHAIDAALKFSTFGIMSSAETKPTGIRGGLLVAPEAAGKSYLSLSRVILKLKPLKEWELVAVIWGIEIGLGIIILLV